MRRLLFCLALLVPSVADAQDFRFRQNTRYRESFRGGRALAPAYVPYGGVYGTYPVSPYYGGTIYSFQSPVLLVSPPIEVRETVVQPLPAPAPVPVYRTETTTTTTYGPLQP